jgi:O-antigen/teichoic acid export membrane protein
MFASKLDFLRLKNLTQLASLNVVVAGLSYILTIALANYLGPQDFGFYSYVLVLAASLTIFIDYATDISAASLMAENKSIKKTFIVIYSVRILIYIILFGLSWLIFLINFLSPSEKLDLFIGVNALILPALYTSFLFELRRKNATFLIIYGVERIIYIIAIASLILFDFLEIRIIFLIFLIISISSLFFQLNFNKKYFGKNFSLNISDAIFILKKNYLLVVVNISAFFYGGYSRLILESQYGLETLGIYSAGLQITNAVTILQSQIDRVWRLDISIAIKEQNIKILKKLIKEYFIFTTIPLTFAAFIIYFSSDLIENYFFSESYNGLSSILEILCFFFITLNFDSLSRICWVALGKFKEYAIISIVAPVTIISILIFSENTYSIESFATFVVIGQLFSSSILLLRARSHIMARNLNIENI